MRCVKVTAHGPRGTGEGALLHCSTPPLLHCSTDPLIHHFCHGAMRPRTSMLLTLLTLHPLHFKVLSPLPLLSPPNFASFHNLPLTVNNDKQQQQHYRHSPTHFPPATMLPFIGTVVSCMITRVVILMALFLPFALVSSYIAGSPSSIDNYVKVRSGGPSSVATFRRHLRLLASRWHHAAAHAPHPSHCLQA